MTGKTALVRTDTMSYSFTGDGAAPPAAARDGQQKLSLLKTIRKFSHRASRYIPILFLTVRLKYRLANLILSPLPDAASPALRRRLYRLAGFNVGPGVFMMGNL